MKGERRKGSIAESFKNSLVITMLGMCVLLILILVTVFIALLHKDTYANMETSIDAASVDHKGTVNSIVLDGTSYSNSDRAIAIEAVSDLNESLNESKTYLKFKGNTRIVIYYKDGYESFIKDYQ